MKKKLLALLLAGTMVFGLAACGSSDSSSSEDSSEEAAVEETEEETDEASSAKTSNEEIALDISDVVILDDEYAKVTVNSGTYKEDDWGDQYLLTVTLENKTSDTTLDLGMESSTVNGVNGIYNGIDPTMTQADINSGIERDWPMDVAPGETMSGLFRLNISKEYVPYIKDVTAVSGTVYVKDIPDDGDSLYSSVPIITGSEFELYPFGEDAATAYSHTSEDDDIVIMDNDQAYIAIIHTDFPEKEYDFFDGTIYAENRTDDKIICDTNGVSCNGYKFESHLFSINLNPGEKSFEGMYILDSDFSDNNISFNEIESIDFNVKVEQQDPDTYESTPLFEGSFSIEP